MMRGILLALVAAATVAGAEPEFVREMDIIYHKQEGFALTMDRVSPTKQNGAAVVFVLSGGWFSSHDMLKPQSAKQLPGFMKKNA